MQRRVMDNFETIDYIISHHCSISRYGDGELSLVFAAKYSTEFHSGFQSFDPQLADRLAQILNYSHRKPNHLVCLPACAFSYGTKHFRRYARDFWNGYIVANINHLLAATAPSKLYGDSTITRFYLSHRDKSRCREFVSKMQQIWQGRDIVFVEGRMTHLGYGNDLFACARSIRRILCPAANAFTQYDTILQTTIANTTPDTLIILALGMTATVLAYDLAGYNRQALDLGHIDIEYEWMLMGAATKVPIPGKFTNEAKGGHISTDEVPEDFQRQIITEI
jgi:glycosyltransferase family protein